MRASEGIDMVEKSVVSYGGVEMGKLERGLIWISLFISLGPYARDSLERLWVWWRLSTLSRQLVIFLPGCCRWYESGSYHNRGGLIVGMVLQVLYNYLVSKNRWSGKRYGRCFYLFG